MTPSEARRDTKRAAPHPGPPRSPLRYPGGKAALAPHVTDLVRATGASVLVEPYAGGAGAGLTLLLDGTVDRLVLGDADPAVSAFWRVVARDPDPLLEAIASVPVTVEEWRRQRARLDAGWGSDRELALALLFCNRTSFSGIARGRPIGGLDQSGAYPIGARFTRQTLLSRIGAVAECGDRITVTGLDGADTVRVWAGEGGAFLFVDPPYVRAGNRLYGVGMDHAEHRLLSRALHAHRDASWLLTYDDHPLVRGLYADLALAPRALTYSHRSRTATELVVASDAVAAALALPARAATGVDRPSKEEPWTTHSTRA